MHSVSVETSQAPSQRQCSVCEELACACLSRVSMKGNSPSSVAASLSTWTSSRSACLCDCHIHVAVAHHKFVQREAAGSRHRTPL